MQDLIDLVKKIVNDKVEEITKEIFIKLENNNFNLSHEINSYHNKFDKIFLETLETVFKEYDNHYLKNIRNKNTKVTHLKTKLIQTEYGEMKFTRRRYKNIQTGDIFYYIDNLIGLEKRQRLDKAFQLSILNQSIKKSYKSVEKVFDNKVTVTTAINIAKRNIDKVIEIEKKTQKRNVNEIFIEADEDHVHLRNKNNLQVKLIYVHEGYKLNLITNKNELVNPKYFSGINKNIWNEVKDYIVKTYNEDVAININGDGARWIKNGMKFFKNSKFLLDKFHIKSSIELITNSKKEKEELYKAIRSSKEKRKLEIYKVFKTYHQNEDFRIFKRVPKFYANRWDYLISNSNYIELDHIKSHCSAEGHISHILSDRMSSRPMAWSKNGALIIAKLRAFKFNHKKLSILSL